mmetsp:Transcript_48530/g.90948  ORF Transcript_48530/g.90948 Transcript_48530/m.90948 type:complete len:146 (-) Transcript_48530:15-452(-)
MFRKLAPVLASRSFRFTSSRGSRINDPEVLQEVTREFEQYEHALTKNDVKELDRFFFDHPTTVRFGTTENLFGFQAIQAFRKNRASPGNRNILQSAITTYGSDYAVTNIVFQRHGSTAIGRQSQTWLRTPAGWKVVSAHVSTMDG